MWIEQLPCFLRSLYPDVIWRKETAEKSVYLTFDDGPIPEVTPWVLGMLDRYQVKATFFCVGENVKKHPEIYREVMDRGHRMGNHTHTHIRGFFTSKRNYLENVELASQYIDTRLFRPPHGELRRSQLRALKQQYEVVQWDVITRDYDRSISGERVFENVRKYVRNGSIIVFHDSLKAERNLRFALPRALEWLQQRGYSFNLL